MARLEWLTLSVNTSFTLSVTFTYKSVQQLIGGGEGVPAKRRRRREAVNRSPDTAVDSSNTTAATSLVDAIAVMIRLVDFNRQYWTFPTHWRILSPFLSQNTLRLPPTSLALMQVFFTCLLFSCSFLHTVIFNNKAWYYTMLYHPFNLYILPFKWICYCATSSPSRSEDYIFKVSSKNTLTKTSSTNWKDI